MNKDQFEHTIRAAGSILGENKVLVIGSQAIHASIDYYLPEAERSIEIDISSLEDDDGTRADLIDGRVVHVPGDIRLLCPGSHAKDRHFAGGMEKTPGPL